MFDREGRVETPTLQRKKTWEELVLASPEYKGRAEGMLLTATVSLPEGGLQRNALSCPGMDEEG